MTHALYKLPTLMYLDFGFSLAFTIPIIYFIFSIIGKDNIMVQYQM